MAVFQSAALSQIAGNARVSPPVFNVSGNNVRILVAFSAKAETLPEFKAADLTRHTSDLFDAAIRSPIAITKHRKPKFVLMSMDQYQQLSRGATQQAHMIDEMPEDLKALMIEGLERDLARADD